MTVAVVPEMAVNPYEIDIDDMVLGRILEMASRMPIFEKMIRTQLHDQYINLLETPMPDGWDEDKCRYDIALDIQYIDTLDIETIIRYWWYRVLAKRRKEKIKPLQRWIKIAWHHLYK